MGSKAFGDAVHDLDSLLAMTRSAITLGEGVSLVVPPAPQGNVAAQLHWGQEAFASEVLPEMEQDVLTAVQAVVEAWHDLLNIQRAAWTTADKHVADMKLTAALGHLSEVMEGE